MNVGVATNECACVHGFAACGLDFFDEDGRCPCADVQLVANGLRIPRCQDGRANFRIEDFEFYIFASARPER